MHFQSFITVRLPKLIFLRYNFMCNTFCVVFSKAMQGIGYAKSAIIAKN